MRNLVVLASVMVLSVCTAMAQETKEIFVSADSAYVENLQYPFDDKGLSLDVQILYNEEDETIRVVLRSNRPVIALNRDVRYKDVFNWTRYLYPYRLPYRVMIEPGTVCHVSKAAWKSFRKRRRNHLFNSWMDGVSSNLTNLDTADVSLPLMADSVVRNFALAPGSTKARFTLRSLIVAEFAGSKHRGHERIYEILVDQDLKLTYSMTIVRNPCFGTRNLVDSLRGKIDDIRRSYDVFLSAAHDGVASSPEEVRVFEQHRTMLLNMFPAIEMKHPCGDVQAHIDMFNGFRDSITQVKYEYLPVKTEESGNEPLLTISSDVLLNAARSIDVMVSKILLTTDPLERRNQIDACNDFVRSCEQILSERVIVGDDREKAMKLYNEARSYLMCVITK